MRRPEVLSPAGNPVKLKTAIAYGADAVYMSGKKFGLRTFSDNFDRDEMKASIAYAHEHGVKCYVTMNVMPVTGKANGRNQCPPVAALIYTRYPPSARKLKGMKTAG